MKNLFRTQHFFAIALLVFALFCAFPNSAFAQTFPEKPSPPRLVNDFAKIYSPQENSLLEAKLVTYEKETSTQIAVVTITSLNGYPIDDYTIKLANHWQIGQKGKNNGLLVLIAKDDHKVFIASGYGLEGALNDGKIGTIIRTKIIPQFKNGNYYAGTNDGIEAMISAAAGEFVNEGEDNLSQHDAEFFAKVFGFILVFLIILFAMWRSRNSPNNYYNDGIFYGSGGRSSGRGNGGSGGFGGFGGGGFGGGGAGGSW